MLKNGGFYVQRQSRIFRFAVFTLFARRDFYNATVSAACAYVHRMLRLHGYDHEPNDHNHDYLFERKKGGLLLNKQTAVCNLIIYYKVYRRKEIE